MPSSFLLWQGRQKEICHLKVTGAPQGVEGAAAPFSTLLWQERRKDYIYFTAPEIPSANCFCRTKKITMVGTEQNSTPIIRTP